MSIIWNVVGKPLAMLGGRSAAELRAHGPADCDKSVLVGVLVVLSIAIIGVGHYLFWRNFPNAAPWAADIALGVAAVFAVVYRIALRALELLGPFAKAMVLALLLGLMGVNAMLAGHELVLFAFAPQVEEQAKLNAAKGVTAYASAVEGSLGLPQMRVRSTELDKAIGAAMTERARIPDNVQLLQQQAKVCDAEALRLLALVPKDPDEPGYAVARSAWRERRARCNSLSQQATRDLTLHQARLDEQLAGLNQSRQRTAKSLDEATTQQEEALKRDTPTLTASATTGFARHGALWAAVAAGSIPAWAAYGLMFAVLALDSFSFVIKLLLRHDRAAAARIRQAAADDLHDRVYAETHSLHRRLVRRAVRSQAAEAEEELRDLARRVVSQELLQEVEERSFAHAAAATERAQQQRSGPPRPALLRRLAQMAASIRGRAQGMGPQGASASA